MHRHAPGPAAPCTRNWGSCQSRQLLCSRAARSDRRRSSSSLSATNGSAAATNGASSSGGGGKRVVVVGGGWAGFGAAKHLAEQGYAVTLLEAAKHPGGLSSGWRSASGRVIEAGMKGMWRDYANTFALLRDLGGEWPLTDWTTSGFWSPRGLTTEAPVFSRLPQLPTLVGQFVHTSGLHWDLPLEERLTMLPFLLSLADFDASPEVFESYDRMSARDLFQRWGVSQRCYEEFLRPTLLVGLFAPPEDLSAAVMLETLYFYALAHQNSFDVCWPKRSIAESIFQPMVQRITSAGSQVIGSQLVTDLLPAADGRSIGAVVARDVSTGTTTQHECDAVVFAVGISAMQKLVCSCRLLAEQPDLRRVMNLRALDVIATRLWFDKRVSTRFPANVLSGFERQAGATFFNLNELQDEYRDAPGSVITADFYGASELLPLSDAELVARVHRHLTTCEPGFGAATVVDSAVLRLPRAVTHFSPGSHASRPRQTTGIPNLFLAGDWVKDVPHGANGLSQERAYVTGLLAANKVVDRCGQGSKATVLDVEPDEAHVVAAKQAARALRAAASAFGIRAPAL